jgi:uncharacterized membrane protein
MSEARELKLLEFEHQRKLKQFEIDNQAKLKQFEVNNQNKLELFKSVMAMAALALRTCIIINGVAAISLLTFMAKAEDYDQDMMVYGLFVFAFGVLLGGMATIVGYLSQNKYMDQANSGDTESDDKTHKNFTIVVCVLTCVCFFVGMILTGGAILR